MVQCMPQFTFLTKFRRFSARFQWSFPEHSWFIQDLLKQSRKLKCKKKINNKNTRLKKSFAHKVSTVQGTEQSWTIEKLQFDHHKKVPLVIIKIPEEGWHFHNTLLQATGWKLEVNSPIKCMWKQKWRIVHLAELRTDRSKELICGFWMGGVQYARCSKQRQNHDNRSSLWKSHLQKGGDSREIKLESSVEWPVCHRLFKFAGFFFRFLCSCLPHNKVCWGSS